jgi:hypothetical protein
VLERRVNSITRGPVPPHAIAVIYYRPAAGLPLRFLRRMTVAQAWTELGLDRYEVRGWRGFHHHMTLVIPTHRFLVLQARRLG